MKKPRLIVLGLAAVLLIPNVVFSDCLTFGRGGPLSWSAQDERTIVFYDDSGGTPIAQVTLQSCKVDASSVVRLSKRYLCDSDKIIVDNTPCNIMSITSASSS